MTITFIVPGPCPGKVRMSQRDRWCKRDVVVRYRAWQDLARAFAAKAGGVPPAEKVDMLMVSAYYMPPESWSQKKQAEAIGQTKRTRPDGDNCAGSLQDALWPDNDAALGDLIVRRRWARESYTEVEIETI